MDLTRKRLDVLGAQYQSGLVSMSELLAAYRDVAFAARDSGLRGEELRRALEDYRDGAARSRDLARSRVSAGQETADAVMHAEASLAEAEFWLAEVRAAP
jgi:hypothetical protein